MDELEEQGVPCVGPKKELALIEGDKAFCKELMRNYGVGRVPKFGVFRDYRDAFRFIEEIGDVAVKPAGLTGGKGVRVMGDHLRSLEDAKLYAKEVIENRIGGLEKVLIEEKLEGEEYTIQAFVDGKNLIPMPAVQDHKRAWEGDRGPNTGGMGSYSDKDHLLPFLSRGEYEESVKIMERTLDALRKEVGSSYKGILYGQFMLTKQGPCLIEYNCRFGDPENMNVLPLVREEPLDIYQKIAWGGLRKARFERKATVCKYLVPEGYPTSPAFGEVISVDEGAIASLGALLFYVSVDVKQGKLLTTRSRALAVLGIGEEIEEAEQLAERATSHVKGALYHRRDIGTRVGGSKG